MRVIGAFAVPPLHVPVGVRIAEGLHGPIRLEAVAVRTAPHRTGTLVGFEVLDRADADELRRWWATLATRETEAFETGALQLPVRWSFGGDRRMRLACGATALAVTLLAFPPYAIAALLPG